MSSIFKGLGKLGNVLEDAASFAVPAGAMIAANAFMPGVGVGLAGALQGGSLLAALGAGARGFAGNEAEERLRKRQLAQNRNNATANFINQLSSRSSYQARQAPTPSPGILEQGARGAAMGLDLAAQARANAMREQSLQGQIDRNQQIMDATAAEAAAGAVGPTPNMGAAGRAVTSTPPLTNTPIASGMAPRGMKIETLIPGIQGPVAPPGINADMFRSAQNRLTQQARDTAFARSQAERLMDLQERSAVALEQYRQGTLDVSKGNLKVAQDSLMLRDKLLFRELEEQAEERARALTKHAREALPSEFLVNPDLTMEEALQKYPSISPDVFRQERARFLKTANDEATQILTQHVLPVIKADALTSNAGNLRFAMGTIASGYEQENGFGDIDMIIGKVRLSDPAVSVRNEDVDTIEKAIAWAEQYDPELMKQMATQGDRLLPVSRDRLFKSAVDLYEQQKAQVQTTLDRIKPWAIQTIGAAVPENRIDQYLNIFTLPPLESYE